MYGYAGKLLHVDLTKGEFREEKLDEDFCRLFIGGAGFNAYHMLKKMKSYTDPMSPESYLCISTGPIAGTFMPSATKAVLSLKGPAGFYISSPSSNIGRYLKYAGYDGMTITGCSESPVYLDIFNDDIQLRDAGHLWGKDIFTATDMIKTETQDASVACIGPAGESRVAFASILLNKQGTWCRSGDGAVMGSKNLKAIAVRGTKGVKVSDPRKFNDLVMDYFRKLESNPMVRSWNELGLLIGWDAWMIHTGKFVTNNFNDTASSEEMTTLYGPEAYRREARAGSSHCHTCPVGCKSALEVKSGEYAGLKFAQSTIFSAIESFGAKCRVGDYNHLLKCAYAINQYGMDNLTFCSRMDLVCDLYEKRMIGLEDTAGWLPRKGFEATMELMELIVKRKGIGNVLAGTWQEVTKNLAKGHEEHVVHLKGTEPANDLRTHVCTENFGQLVCPRGGHNMNALSITIVPHRKLNSLRKFAKWMGMPEERIHAVVVSEDEAEYVPGFTKWVEDYNVMLLNLGLCNRPPYQQMLNPEACTDLFRTATGFDITPEELLKSGERALVMERLFNCREGFSRKEDQPPPKWVTESTWVDGREIKPLSPKKVNEMLGQYYLERGWNKQGIPEMDKLKELHIENMKL
jgi:aldehyde:ferredoxin oxidoreductase